MRTKEVFPYYKALRSHSIELLIKRIFDFSLSAVMIFLLAPVFAVLALWIKLDSKGPVFYTQKRVTQYGKIFWIYKFRTMVVNADQKGSLVTTSGDPRITGAGKWLRKYRLDELPQLMNIWKGEMSFVGTRPEVVRYVKQYTKEMYATLLMPAGVTSRASIAFKDEDRLLGEGMGENTEENREKNHRKMGEQGTAEWAGGMKKEADSAKRSSLDEIYIQKILPKKMEYNLEALREFHFWGELGLMCATIRKVLEKES